MDHLFLIAIDDYEHWAPLRAPVKDAEGLVDVLCGRYGFPEEGITRLYNRDASNGGIVQGLRELKDRLGPEDRLLMFYAGHGFTDPYDNVGFLIPADAERSDVDKRGWFPNVSLRGHLRAMEARHILVISDACFSGDLLDEHRDLNMRSKGWDMEADRLKSRAILTSGSSEPVQDVDFGGHSPFAWHLVDTLKCCSDAWVDAQGLFEQVRRGVKGQRPLYGTLKGGGDRGGALILRPQVRPTPRPRVRKRPEERSEWYAVLGDREEGPLTESLLREWKDSGKVGQESLVWKAGMVEWVELGGLEAFYEAKPPPRPVVASAPPPRKREPEPGTEKTIELPGGIALKLCWCPATTSDAWKAISCGEDFFWMGSPEEELGRSWESFFLMREPEEELGWSSDETQHHVRLTRGFWMGKYPLTQRQWKAVAGENPSSFKKSGPDAPVESVSWEDVVKWIAKADGRLGGVGLDLPTEAQWEYACRAGTHAALNNGKELTTEDEFCPNLARVGWFNENSEGMTHPVGQLTPNAWGLYDMHGNVSEWCQDWYGDYEEDLQEDPTGPADGSYRVRRGGSWNLDASDCRVASRISWYPSHTPSPLGFRVALAPQFT